MRNLASMSGAEIREHLKFTPRWYSLGVMDDVALDLTIRSFRASDDDSDVRWRYGAFMHFLSRHPTLTPEQCEGLFLLGAEDPDWVMGQSIMLRILERPECPDDLYTVAGLHPRTEKYAAEMRRRHDFDPVQFRKELQALGPDRYYLEYGFHQDGRRRKDQTVYKEMRDLFGIDFTRFHAIKNAAYPPGE